jgi:glucose/arabinose dehydrogenase
MKNILLLAFLTIGFINAQIQVGSTILQEREVVNGLDVPWEIKWGPDSNGDEDFLWVTERSGIISRINVETGEKHVILDIQNNVTTEAESGLLGMEFHPDFANNSIVFIVYTYYQGWDIKERLSAFTYNSNQDILENEQYLINGITGYSTHNGSRLHSLDDNTLLMTTGDAQNQSDSQDVGILTGKTLRIDISNDNFGGIPLDNPISGSYVWSWGHRNAQGLEVAPNGIIYSSEHGPNSDDELNIIEPNRNYGWPNVNGFCDGFSEQAFCLENNVVEPLVNWTPTIAPSDIIWYNHPSIPEFENTLLMTVLKDKMLVRFEFSDDGFEVVNSTEFFNYEWGRLRDICVSPDGKIYLATNGNSWPSSGPNEIIELYNADYNNTNITELDTGSLNKYSIDIFGRIVSNEAKGVIIEFDQNGNTKKYLKK